MDDFLVKLEAGTSLNRDESYRAFSMIMAGQVTDANITTLLQSIASRGATVDEIIGAASVMRERATPIDTSAITRPIVDTCGTGGDVKGTFNISTAAAIIAASAGAAVVKHGNRSASGRSGSADVLEALGVNIDASADRLCLSLREANICFAFARHHHPAMRHVAAVRKALGIPTIFNLLGPLTNPAGAKNQLIGVFAPHLTELLARVLKELGSDRAWVVHGDDGLDELSTMSSTRVSELRFGFVRTFAIDSAAIGLQRTSLEELRADSPGASAAIIKEILAGKHGPPRDIAVLNAAAALLVAGVVDELNVGVERAMVAVDSGAAARTLEDLVEISNQQ